MDKKFIPIPGEIGNRRQEENLGTTEAATNIDAEEPPGPSNGSGRWQGRGREGKAAKDGATSVTSVTKRLGADWNIKGRARRKELVGDRGNRG